MEGRITSLDLQAILPNKAQDTTSLLCHKSIFLEDVQLLPNRMPGSFFPCKAAFHLVSSLTVQVHRVIPPQEQSFTLPFLEIHEILTGPFLHPVEVSLNGSIAFW